MASLLLSRLPSAGLLSDVDPTSSILRPGQVQARHSAEVPVLIESDPAHMLVRSLKLRRKKELGWASVKRPNDAVVGSSPAKKRLAVAVQAPGTRTSRRAGRLQEVAAQTAQTVPSSSSSRRMRRKRPLNTVAEDVQGSNSSRSKSPE
uniref:Uncharacterized protein n=1 Tax=Spongospora subterranea TaxID=70186 RepID=A0A0H5RB27_9EUKA|eukprot:CRZ05674.1 hypothetical protein [Spongospora subterranea]